MASPATVSISADLLLAMEARLESLNASECKQLLSLRLRAPQLTRLTATGCGLLATVVLACPRRTHLVLNLCKRLQLLQLECAAPLAHLNLHSCRELGVPALQAALRSSGGVC